MSAIEPAPMGYHYTGEGYAPGVHEAPPEERGFWDTIGDAGIGLVDYYLAKRDEDALALWRQQFPTDVQSKTPQTGYRASTVSLGTIAIIGGVLLLVILLVN
jgi:hypothetical protein